MKLNERHPELEPIIKGGSYKQLFDLFYTLNQLRYATKANLNRINAKMGTPKKLKTLVDLGFLFFTDKGYYYPTSKTLKILENEGYNTNFLQKKFKGEAGDHQQKLTDRLITFTENEHFYSISYPIFCKAPRYTEPFLIPDALICFKNDKGYKLLFVEVENSEKPPGYLESKERNYKIIASDYNTWAKWWKAHCSFLGLPFCKVENFCFEWRAM
jgi:hypothetical protein